MNIGIIVDQFLKAVCIAYFVEKTWFANYKPVVSWEGGGGVMLCNTMHYVIYYIHIRQIAIWAYEYPSSLGSRRYTSWIHNTDEIILFVGSLTIDDKNFRPPTLIWKKK